MTRQPLDVAHLGAGNLYGGIEAMLVTIARTQARCPGARHRVLLAFEGACATTLREAGSAPVILGPVRVRAPWSVWAARRRLAAHLRQRRPDIAITHSPWTHAVFGPVLALAHVPIVFWRHGASDGRHWLERWARRTRPDLVLANSHFTAAATPVFRGVATRVVCPPVEVPPASTEAERQALRATLGASPDRVVILQASRLEPGKGHEMLLRALSALRHHDAWTCWIAGGAQREAERRYALGLERQAKDLGVADRVRFLGQRSDASALLAASDLLCQPNTGPDAFGIVFVEALAHGVPVVTTSIGAAPEIVTSACGRLTPPGDPAALASSLAELLDDPTLRRALGREGPARAALVSDPVRQLSRLEELLRPLLAGHLSSA